MTDSRVRSHLDYVAGVINDVGTLDSNDLFGTWGWIGKLLDEHSLTIANVTRTVGRST